ncbi:MAG: Crp/Fnr family transcriptional regulator [Candidatus Latescibacteria bacterium]|nr:Crp/Fnr family transcriptional regulator [Candidatus Latescibacterota bacterium]
MELTEQALKQVPLFSGLNDQDLAALAQVTVSKRFPKENLIVLAEDEGNSLFVIVTGRVKVSITSEDGREVIFSLLSDGECFGEMSLLDGQPRSATVTAASDTDVLMLRRQDFLRLLEQVPQIGIKLLSVFTGRLRRADRKIESLALLDVPSRVVVTLLRLAEDQGKLTDGGILVENRPTHQELANMVGTTRETVSRVLKRLEQQGFIETVGRHLKLSELEALRGEYNAL